MRTKLLFPSIYLCYQGFSALFAMKNTLHSNIWLWADKLILHIDVISQHSTIVILHYHVNETVIMSSMLNAVRSVILYYIGGGTPLILSDSGGKGRKSSWSTGLQQQTPYCRRFPPHWIWWSYSTCKTKHKNSRTMQFWTTRSCWWCHGCAHIRLHQIDL